MNTIINTLKAPQAIGPYSQAILAGNTLFISGQIAINPKSGEIFRGDIQDQTRLILKNMEAILKEAGMDLTDVVKTTCLLKSMDDFEKMNEAYAEYFSIIQPARATFAVKTLPKNVDLEIDAIAVKQ